MWRCDNVTDIVGSWDAHASKNYTNSSEIPKELLFGNKISMMVAAGNS